MPPTYDYYCKDCETNFEKLVPLSDDRDNVACLNCGSKKTKRRYSAIRVIYKGEGFYSTDKDKK